MERLDYTFGVTTERRQTLLRNIARLRRAERALPHNRELALVRGSLEQELGGTVSIRLAASTLGVTHTTLRRWIARGDVPVVFTPAGRHEIPIGAVLDLADAVEAANPAGHRIEAVMIGQRERARRIRVSARRGDGHDRAAARGLAYHQAIAARLSAPMVDAARRRLWIWQDRGTIDQRYGDRWEQILHLPREQIREAMVADSADGRDLRQNSPFAGALSEPERREILRQVG